MTLGKKDKPTLDEACQEFKSVVMPVLYRVCQPVLAVSLTWWKAWMREDNTMPPDVRQRLEAKMRSLEKPKYTPISDTDPGRREMLAVGRFIALVAAIAAGVVIGLWFWNKVNG